MADLTPGTPMNCPAGEARLTTTYSGTGRAADPAGRSPRPARAASATVRSGPAVLGTPPGTAGGTTSAAVLSLALSAAANPSSPQPCRERAAAGRPDPGAGREDPAAGNRMPSRPGRGTDTSSGRGAPANSQVTSVPPAGSRTYTIALPAGMELLNANDRDSHWARRRRITGALREAAAWLARQQHIPALQRAYILGVYEPPDRRRRDPANLYPSFKACVDGLVDAGVLADDDAAHLDGPDMRLGEICRRGRLVLRVTEIAATGGAA